MRLNKLVRQRTNKTKTRSKGRALQGIGREDSHLCRTKLEQTCLWSKWSRLHVCFFASFCFVLCFLGSWLELRVRGTELTCSTLLIKVTFYPRTSLFPAHMSFRLYAVPCTPEFQGLRCSMYTCIPGATLFHVHLNSRSYDVQRSLAL